jgi:hypothetical protein
MEALSEPRWPTLLHLRSRNDNDFNLRASITLADFLNNHRQIIAAFDFFTVRAWRFVRYCLFRDRTWQAL